MSRTLGTPPQQTHKEAASNYIGIDIAKDSHVAAVKSDSGEAIGEELGFRNDEAGFKGLGPSSTSPEVAEGLKQLTRYRLYIVQERTALKNRATALADRLFPELASFFGGGVKSDTFRAVLRRFGTPEAIARTDIRTIEKVIRVSSHNRFGREKAERLKELAKHSVGIRYACGAFAFELAHVLDLVERLDDEVAELESEISRLLRQTDGTLLESIPGVGPVTAAIIVGEIGDSGRFETPGKLVAFAGMDAAVRQSGKFEGTETHMSKRGFPYLRYGLMQAAENVRLYDPYFRDYYDAMRDRGKHHYVALSGVARKLCGVVLALMKEQREYEKRPSIQSQVNKD